MSQVSIIVPVYNEIGALKLFLGAFSHKISALISNLPIAVSSLNIVVVDDGSSLAVNLHSRSFPKSFPFRLFLLRHEVNLGQGAAIQTGLKYALEHLDSDYFVTMDSDGQHQPEDLPTLFKTLIDSNVDIVFGNRFDFRVKVNAPIGRKLLLKAAVVFERKISGLDLSDAHNGYRVFNRKCAQSIKLKQNRMAHATEFKQLVKKHNLRYAEAPVSILYSDETLAKGQKNIGSLFILKDLLKAYLFKG